MYQLMVPDTAGTPRRVGPPVSRPILAVKLAFAAKVHGEVIDTADGSVTLVIDEKTPVPTDNAAEAGFSRTTNPQNRKRGKSVKW